MGVSKVFERLLRIRALEEEQRRASLASAVGELEALQRAGEAAIKCERQGHAQVRESAFSGEIVDRRAAVVQLEAARLHRSLLAPRIAASELESARRRQEFLEKRVERRQAGTLVEEALAREAIELDRRNQQTADESHTARRLRASASASKARPRQKAGKPEAVAESNENGLSETDLLARNVTTF